MTNSQIEDIGKVLHELNTNPDYEVKKRIVEHLKVIAGDRSIPELLTTLREQTGVEAVRATQNKFAKRTLSGANKKPEAPAAPKVKPKSDDDKGLSTGGALSMMWGDIKKGVKKLTGQNESEEVVALDPVRDHLMNISTQQAHAASMASGMGALELRKILAARNNS